jgi:oxalate decarboxylase/phosphoglucose isomerase-like protein (cupin superfamily)
MSKLAGRRFIRPADVETQLFDWGTIKWLGEPRVTATERFTMGVVLLQPGKGHVRHNHPGTEEILYVVSGQGKQMIDIGPRGASARHAGVPGARTRRTARNVAR